MKVDYICIDCGAYFIEDLSEEGLKEEVTCPVCNSDRVREMTDPEDPILCSCCSPY